MLTGYLNPIGNGGFDPKAIFSLLGPLFGLMAPLLANFELKGFLRNNVEFFLAAFVVPLPPNMHDRVKVLKGRLVNR